MKMRTILTSLVALFTLAACNDSPMPAEPAADDVTLTSVELAPAPVTPMLLHQEGPTVVGRTIQNLNVLLEDGSTFTGRIVNLTFEVVEGDLLASGRLIGELDGQRINEVFEGVNLGPITDLLEPGAEACQILFLELGPIFLDVLGLIVEVPDPIVVEIRAEPGPGQLLGNLLCALLGILD